VSAGYERLVELLADKAAVATSSRAAQASRAAPGAAARLYNERRRREQWFGPRLFWEPSWDILLYLYAAHDGGEDIVPVDQLGGLEIAVSPDSIARWIALLRDQDLVAIRAHEGGVCLSLTAHGLRGMSGYLESIAPFPALMDRPRVS